MNIEYPIAKSGRKSRASVVVRETPNGRVYDLDDRLVDFAVAIVDVVEMLPMTRAGNHLAGQLIRSGTSPAANYAEAQGAESRRDFIHKLRIALKELRETRVWLRIIARKGLLKSSDQGETVLRECEELIRIFAASIVTATNKNR